MSRCLATAELISPPPLLLPSSASSSPPPQVCADKNALFFTGDTCQTIARGVGFRFEDLTTMFYQANPPCRILP